MTRPLRIEYEGAWYHVMNRGANKQNIFFTNEHRTLFLDLLCEISKKFYLEIHSYCLMSNHYHLLIRTPLPNLSKAMRHLDGVYTLKFNRSTKKDGPLFRGRYKSILIEEEIYLLQVSRYIHLNPVSANLCSMSQDYRWSSYSCYLQKKSGVAWLQTKFILNLMNNKNYNESYKKYIEDGLDHETELFYKESLSPILGSEKFIKEKLCQLSEKQHVDHFTDINKIKKLPDLEIITNTVCDFFKVQKQYIRNNTQGKKNIERLIAIYLSIQLGQITHQEVAKYFGNINRKSITNIFKRGEVLIQKNKELKEQMNQLFKLIIGNLSDVSI